jgi:hypothetical protein
LIVGKSTNELLLSFGVADLVFFQNGMLEPWLESKGLKDGNQVLAYFAVSKLGESPIDGKTDTNPEGLTAAYGKWSLAVSERLKAGGLSCKVVFIRVINHILPVAKFSCFGYINKNIFYGTDLLFSFWEILVF